MRNVTTWYKSAWFFKKTKFTHLKPIFFHFKKTKQLNASTFSNKTGEKFNLAKIFRNVKADFNMATYVICVFFFLWNKSNAEENLGKEIEECE